MANDERKDEVSEIWKITLELLEIILRNPDRYFDSDLVDSNLRGKLDSVLEAIQQDLAVIEKALEQVGEETKAELGGVGLTGDALSLKLDVLRILKIKFEEAEEIQSELKWLGKLFDLLNSLLQSLGIVSPFGSTSDSLRELKDVVKVLVDWGKVDNRT